jgi:hypothetical protein
VGTDGLLGFLGAVGAAQQAVRGARQWVALYDYAEGAQSILNHEVRILVPADSPVILTGVKRRFEAKFEVILYASPSDIVCDALYVRLARTATRNWPCRVAANFDYPECARFPPYLTSSAYRLRRATFEASSASAPS